MILFEHLDIWVVRQAGLTYGGKIRRFPTRAIKVLLDLGWHDEIYLSVCLCVCL